MFRLLFFACLFFACLLSVRLTCIHSEHDCLLTQGFCPTRRELARSSLKAEDISMIMGAKDKYVRPAQNTRESPFNRQQVAQISHISPELHDTIKEKKNLTSCIPVQYLSSHRPGMRERATTTCFMYLRILYLCIFCVCVFVFPSAGNVRQENSYLLQLY